MFNKRLLSLAVAGSMILGLSGLAMAGIPDETLSTATSASGCAQIRPDGLAPSLATEGLTITVTVVDSNGDPIAGYPFQDVSGGDNGSGDIALCQGGFVADANTNASGVTTISGSVAGGGSTQSGLNVYLAGVKLTGPALLIDLVSADINGDLFVNAIDVGDFALDFNSGTNPFRSDFNCDGIVNLIDVGDLGLANGTRCQ